MTERELLLLCALARRERSDLDVPRLVARFGSVERLFTAGHAALRSAGVSPASATAIRETAAADTGTERAALERHGVTALPWTDERYPASLRNISDRPTVLFVRGPADALARHAVAVVGTRRASGHARDAARDIAAALANCGITVTSGLAYGIDAAAHAAALDNGGSTVAVLASGVDADNVGPRANAWIAERMAAEGGALVSEYPPGMPAAKHRFPRRNRIIAALSMATVVVQAPERSGALITAKAALEYGKDVFAAPGPMTDPACGGSNALIASGAIPVCAAGDVAAYYGLTAPRPQEPANEDQRAVLDALRRGATVLDDIIATTELPAPRALAAIASLELGGRVSAARGAYREIDNAYPSPLP